MLLTISIVSAGSITHLLDWSGGVCSLCNGSNGNYACSNSYSQWNNGKNTFIDQIPAGNILTGINVKLHGVWGCAGFNFIVKSEINVTLQGHEIETKNNILGQCACSSCDQELEFSWSNNGLCFSDYNYINSTTGINVLQLLVLAGRICVKEAILELTHEPGTQDCGQYVPPSCDTFGGCQNGGNCIIDNNTLEAYCDCSTGWHGPNCQCNISSNHLKTYNDDKNSPPIIDIERSGFLTVNTLHLFFNTSAKYHDTTVTFKNSLNNMCDYPKASDAILWIKTFIPTDCLYSYEGIIPWRVAWPTCVFNRTENNKTILFDGEMIINYKENVGSLRNTEIIRYFEHRLWFQVIFPKNIIVSKLSVDTTRFPGSNRSLIGTHSNVTILASITEQTFESVINQNQLPGTASVKLLTSVQYPFQLLGPMFIESSISTFSMNIIESNTSDINCLDDGLTCEQIWIIDIIPNINECNFDGLYTFNFSVTCFPTNSEYSHFGCPLDNETNTGSIVFVLHSEDFCPQLVETIDLTGLIQSFGDSARTLPKNDFLFFQTFYGLINTDSVKSTIVDLAITDFEIILWDNSNLVFVSNNANTGLGNTVNFVITDGGGSANQSHFEFDIIPSVFPVSVDSSEQVTCLITVDVTFLNTDSVKKRMLVVHKRFIQQDDQSQVSDTFNMDFNVEDFGHNNQPLHSGSGQNIISVNGLIIVLFMAVFLF
jgi:hypothetical protein